MNDDTIQDLKQFIATTITQQTAGLATKEDMASLNNHLSAKIDELSNSVADALESNNEANEAQLNDHEQRIKKLEQNIA